MTATVFIDGAVGTTGLEIADRLSGRSDFTLLILDDAQRKDAAARRDAYHAADFAVLCLPDEAAIDAVALAQGSRCRIIDASSAHRVANGWTYGFPELIGRDAVASAQRVSNPGCYPTGFLALVAPLVRGGLMSRDQGYSVNAVSGYSGGGKALIERFETAEPDLAFRSYATSLDHKHLAEMQHYAQLGVAPLFSPAVVPGFRGMIVEVPLHLDGGTSADDLRAALADYYADSALVTLHQDVPAELLLRRNAPPSDRLDLWVLGSADGKRARLVAMLDNLGKGASGAAVQSLNLMAGLPETAGLRL